MNSKLFLDAMEDINETYIIRAQERLGYLTAHRKSQTHSMKRLFTVMLAAVLALLCTVAVAMAVNPELREAIISLFQIGEVEQVPGIPAGVNEVKQVTIGGEVSAQYVKVEGIWYGDDGQDLLVRWDGGPQSGFDRQAEHFYDLIDGELVEVGADAPETSAHLSWQGRDIDIRFRSFPYNGRLYICGSHVTGFGDPTSGSMHVERLGSRTDVVVLRGECYQPVDANWAWICDVKTGEVRDVLADCGIDEIDPIAPILFAEDLKHAIARGRDGISGPGYTPYLADLEGKTHSPLSELMGLDIPTAFGSYEVTFCGSDTVLLSMAPVWRPEPTSVWAYHIPSGMVTPTVSEETELQGIWSGNVWDWMLAQKVDEDGSVTIVDLHTGGRVKLEGITVSHGERCYFKANDSLTKLLWVEWGDGGSALDRLGVVDLETGVFTALAREDLDIRRNASVFWMGDDRVVVMLDIHPDEPHGSDPTREYYLCVYEF